MDSRPYYKTLGWSRKTVETVCRVMKISLWGLMAVLPLTVLAILYILIEEPTSRDTLLEILIGINLLAYVPYMLTGHYARSAGLSSIVFNPGIYLGIVYWLDHSKNPDDKPLANWLLAGIAVLSFILIGFRFVMYSKHAYEQCGWGGINLNPGPRIRSAE
jgi:hypothetical protein